MKFRFSLSISLTVFMGFVGSSCEKDKEVISSGDATAVSEEAVVDSYFQDVDDLSAVAIGTPTDDQYSGGRKSTTVVISDERFDCEGVVVTIEPSTSSTIEHPVGVLTIDFGTTGCQDGRGNVRKGKLICQYDGWRFQPGSEVVIIPENYFINDIKLEGVRTSVNITASQDAAPTFHVVLENGKATFADGSVALRDSDITWSWIRDNNPINDKLIILNNSVAEGTTRNGTAYQVSLLDQLEYHRFCAFAVSGVKKYVIDENKEFTVDYGDGNCDRTVDVTTGGQTMTITL